MKSLLIALTLVSGLSAMANEAAKVEAAAPTAAVTEVKADAKVVCADLTDKKEKAACIKKEKAAKHAAVKHDAPVEAKTETHKAN